jgi:hypothetical protein
MFYAGPVRVRRIRSDNKVELIFDPQFFSKNNKAIRKRKVKSTEMIRGNKNYFMEQSIKKSFSGEVSMPSFARG